MVVLEKASKKPKKQGFYEEAERNAGLVYVHSSSFKKWLFMKIYARNFGTKVWSHWDQFLQKNDGEVNYGNVLQVVGGNIK